MIEQSRKSNCAGLSEIATMAAMSDYCDISIIFETIGYPEIREAGRAMAAVLHNPWVGIRKPVVTSATYSSLRYLCHKVNSVIGETDSLNRLQGYDNRSYRVPKATLDALATSVSGQMSRAAYFSPSMYEAVAAHLRAVVVRADSGVDVEMQIDTAGVRQNSFMISRRACMEIIRSTWPRAIDMFLRLCKTFIADSVQAEVNWTQYDDAGNKVTALQAEAQYFQREIPAADTVPRAPSGPAYRAAVAKSDEVRETRAEAQKRKRDREDMELAMDAGTSRMEAAAKVLKTFHSHDAGAIRAMMAAMNELSDRVAGRAAPPPAHPPPADPPGGAE